MSEQNYPKSPDHREYKSSMLISVVIPTCDRPKEYLLSSVRSALGQSFPPHEVLVIDNGEQQLNGEEMPKGLKLFRTSPRIGQSKARNFGARQATGSHIAFLDDDDWWDEDFLNQTAVALLENSYRCVYGKIIQCKNGELSDQRNLTAQTATIDILLRHNPGTGGINLLIEKDLFEKIGGFDEKLEISEDRALAIEVLRAGERIGIVPEAIAYARHHEGAQLKDRNSQKIMFVLKYWRLMPLGLFIRHFIKFGFWIHVRPERTKRQ